MAVTDLTGATLNPNAAGVALPLATSPTAEGDVVNPGDVLIVQNDSAGSVTVSADAYRTIEGIALGDGGGSVAAGAVKAFRFGGSFAQPSEGLYPGKVLVTYSAQTDVHRAVVRA